VFSQNAENEEVVQKGVMKSEKERVGWVKLNEREPLPGFL
jgi:hypothetical protein